MMSRAAPTYSSSTIALVTVLFNSEPYLPQFFECWAQQTDRDICVIVVDNASQDESLMRARELAEQFRVQCEFVHSAENVGYGAGGNIGIEKARELGLQHIVLINNDISCESSLIAGIRDHAIALGHRAWTCLAWYGDRDVPWYGGGYLSFWRARGVHMTPAQCANIREPVPVTFAPTCLMYFHTTVFDEVGLMDPQYFVYYEDTDLCRRMKDAGIELIYDPTVAFRHHVGGSSGGKRSPFIQRMSTRNKFIYIRKFYRQPARTAVTAMALGSKLVQLLSKERREPTWQGLREAFSTTTLDGCA
jgi:GT2 family glycosyltransferase